MFMLILDKRVLGLVSTRFTHLNNVQLRSYSGIDIDDLFLEVSMNRKRLCNAAAQLIDLFPGGLMIYAITLCNHRQGVSIV